MAIGPKTRRYLEARKDPNGPNGPLPSFMRSMEQMARETAQDAIAKALDAPLVELKKQLAKETSRLLADFPTELKRALKTKLDSLPALRGAPGYTPVKGEDYFDGDPGYTPVEGLDYLSIPGTRKMVAEYADAAFERMKKEGMTKKEMQQEIQRLFEADWSPAAIARGLETLTGTDRLDYEALKNRPGVSVEDTRRHTLHRGGGPGKQTYYYDLSDQCDGALKTFAIPPNTRVVAVSGTDAPGGIYRPLVDWTGSGMQTLTLTGEVAAPTQGATLYILYVQ